MHGCGARKGVNMDGRTLKAHLRDDRSRLALEAHSAPEHAVSAQEDDISAYLASMTLADNVSGAPKRQGGRLWARERPDAVDLDNLENNVPTTAPEAPTPISGSQRREVPPSRKTVTTALTQRLAEINSSADQLARTTSEAISHLVYPPGKTPTTFPLVDLLVACNSLLDDVDHVKNKVHAVVELQCTVRQKLDNVRDSILKAKRLWKESLKCQDAPNQSGVKHNNGKLTYLN
jgi:hypothetical protein